MIDFLNTLSIYILPLIIATILIHALIKKTPAYENFTLGAADGFKIAIKIIKNRFFINTVLFDSFDERN